MSDKQNERISLSVTADIDDRLVVLRDLAPQAFTDGVLDLSRLEAAFDSGVRSDEGYGLSWAGKSRAQSALSLGTVATLRPDREASVSFQTAKNILIEGDNLEVLRLLQPGYNDRIKLIYIDPPYNTGKDFIYKDDYRNGLDAYLRTTGQLKQGGRVSSNTETSGRYHSDWLSMIYPRLALARNLLTQDGVLLVSINDVELNNLRLVLDEVFGPENFVATFIWNNEGNIEQQSAVKVNHEYIVAYARQKKLMQPPSVIDPNIGEDSKLFNEAIENSITKNGPANPASQVTLPLGFPCRSGDGIIPTRTDSWPHILDALEITDGELIKPARLYSGWSSKKLLDLFIANGCVPITDNEGKETSFAVTSSGAIYMYKVRPQTQDHMLTVLRNMGTTKKQSANLYREYKLDFSFPKPEYLIEYLVTAFSEGNDLVLDFFAGSGTTATAVMRANRKDGATRRFILVQLGERPADSAMLDAGYDSIFKMTTRRVAGDSVKYSNGESGFRVFRLGESNFKIWDSSETPTDAEELATHLALFSESLAGDSTDESVLFEILLKDGAPLDSELEEHEFVGKRGVLVNGRHLVYLSREFDEDAVPAMLTTEPSQVTILEVAFAANDGLKANVYQKFGDAGVRMRTV